MSDKQIFESMPVAGYKNQTADRLVLVNRNKLKEEVMLGILDELSQDPNVDKLWLAIGRTQLEQAFMAINRSIFKPSRFTPNEEK